MVIGAGSGLSTERALYTPANGLKHTFSDFARKYGFGYVNSAAFIPLTSPEEYWAYWSRYIYINRYQDAPKPVYEDLFKAVQDKDYFIITTNVDPLLSRSRGFDKSGFYTQGDYGLFQCSEPCCQETFDNEAVIREMVKAAGKYESPDRASSVLSSLRQAFDHESPL